MSTDDETTALDHAGFPFARLPPLELPFDVDAHVYRTMQEMVRLMEWQSAYRARITEIPVTPIDLEYSVRRILKSVVDELAAMLEYESERMAHLGAPATHVHPSVGTDWTRVPLPPGMTRNQCLEQSTAYAHAVTLVRGFIRWGHTPKTRPVTPTDVTMTTTRKRTEP